jgi:beta-barrel assembly-enhancing protease
VRFRFGFAMALLLTLHILPGVSFADSQSDRIAGYRALTDQDARLATIGYRLAIANRAYCAEKTLSLGWSLHDLAQYPDPAIARAAFGFASPIAVAAVVPGGPAEQAGVQQGDGLTAIQLDGAWQKIPPDSARDKTGNYERMDQIQHMIAQTIPLTGLQTGSINVEMARSGSGRIIQLTPQILCASDFQIDTKKGRDAGADGAMVSVTYDLARYVPDDEELAAVVAHEMAHNLLKHRLRLASAKTDKGAKGKARLRTLDTEIEADQLSVWLMSNAGYDPSASVRFWQHYGRSYGLELFTGGTHLRWKNRVVLLQNEIAKIRLAPKKEGLLVPPLLAPR